MSGLQHGKRYQIIVLEVFRNKDGIKNELFKLQEYFKKRQNEHYKVITIEYGRLENALEKLVKTILNQNILPNPFSTIIKLNQAFIDAGKLKTWQIGDVGLYAELSKVMQGFKKMFGRP